MPELVSIPISIFELTADYQRANIKPWSDRITLVQRVLDTFQPWGVNIDNVETPSTGKFSEQGVKFQIPEKRISGFFGPASCKFTKEAATWTTSGETLEILNLTLSIATGFSEVNFSSYKTILAMHLQPKVLPFVEILKPFVSPQLFALSPEDPPRTMAVVVKWKFKGITLDGSGSIANGIFARLEREFIPVAAVANMAEELQSLATEIQRDEQDLFQMLNIEEEHL